MNNEVKSARRKRMKEDGFFDGRFKSRVVADKKKLKNRRACKVRIVEE